MIMTKVRPRFSIGFIIGDGTGAYVQEAHLSRDIKLLKI